MFDEVFLDGSFVSENKAIRMLLDAGNTHDSVRAYLETAPRLASFARKKANWQQKVLTHGASKGQTRWVLIGPDGKAIKYSKTRPKGLEEDGAGDEPETPFVPGQLTATAESGGNDLDRLRKAIHKGPLDEGAGLAYADALEESGDVKGAVKARKFAGNPLAFL
jgi:uncharacterized protein (TIGR02996 family)